MPGKIVISIMEDSLTISGEKKQNKEAGELDYQVIERRYGRFSRHFQLPSSINPGQVRPNTKMVSSALP